MKNGKGNIDEYSPVYNTDEWKSDGKFLTFYGPVSGGLAHPLYFLRSLGVVFWFILPRNGGQSFGLFLNFFDTLFKAFFLLHLFCKNMY